MEAWREELYHFGTKGMHWGTRHWQNPDGTFNEAGKERYFSNGGGENYKKLKKVTTKQVKTVQNQNGKTKNTRFTDEQKKKIAKIAVATLATAAIVGGTIYLAKTGKLDGVISKGKNAFEKGLEPIRLKRIDPHGFINSDALKSTVSKADISARSMWEKESSDLGLGKTFVDTKMIGSKASTNRAYSKLIKDLSDKEIASINNGEKTLKDFYLDRLDKGLYSSKSSSNKISNIIGKVKDTVVSGNNSISNVRKGIVNGSKKVSSGVKNVTKAASSGVKNATKAASSGAKKVIKTAAEASKEKLGEQMWEYAKRVGANKVQNYRKQKQVVSQYKREHPGTKLTDKEILENYGGY